MQFGVFTVVGVSLIWVNTRFVVSLTLSFRETGKVFLHTKQKRELRG